MKKVSIIVPAGECILSSVVGCYKVFASVNKLLAEQGRPTHYDIQLVGLKPETGLYGDAFTIRPTHSIEDVESTDLVLVTTINGDIPAEIRRNSAFVPWILKQYAKGAEVASLCMGAFLLAETGLLNGKECTTHWMGADAFRAMYPKAHLVTEKIITDENGIYTSGGAYSFLNLLLHLVEKYSGREIAIMVAKIFEIDIDRNTQAHFSIFRGQMEHGDTRIKEAQRFIEDNFTERIRVDELATRTALSRRNFVRRFKKATHNTPLEYIQRVKIEAAKKSLESSTSNVSEVMFSVGYNDTKAFRQTFRKYTGFTPMEYRNKYNRHLGLVGSR